MGRIIWIPDARQERTNICKYWNKRNGNNNYSKKLNAEIKHILKLVKENPFIGVEVEEFYGVRRVLVLQNYSLFYKVKQEDIYILSFWDNRQNSNNKEI